jgi:5-methylthioadenosine/S-adenosylhomocysteine deaminase
LSSLLIRDAAVITMDDQRRVHPRASILIEGSVISGVITEGEPPAADRVIEAAGQVALPGFINAHTHAAMTLFRGMADDLPLKTWLEERIWPTEARLEPDDVYWGAMLAIAEMIRAGVTTFNDMYHFFEATARAVADSGIRANLSGVLLGFLPDAGRRLEAAIAFAREWRGACDGRLVTMLGPHAPYTCPVPLLERVIAAACELSIGLHVHLSETAAEVEESRQTCGVSPVEFMNQIDLFSCRPVLAAHCVHLSDGDIELLREKRVGVSHNPGSNLKLASGIARLPDLLRAGVVVGLGTDGAASNNNLDLLEEARLAALVHKGVSGDPTVVSAQQALFMATRGGAQALGIQDRVGMIQSGMHADVILMDFSRPHLWPPHNLISHLVYAARAADVRTVLVDGRPLLLDGVLQTIDEERVMAETQARARRLLEA